MAAETHPALSFHPKTKDDGSRFHCVQADRMAQLISEVDEIKATLITVANQLAQTHQVVTTLSAHLHDEEVAERTISEIDRRAKEEKEAARLQLKDRAEWFKLAFDVLAKVGPWVVLAVGWALQHR